MCVCEVSQEEKIQLANLTPEEFAEYVKNPNFLDNYVPKYIKFDPANGFTARYGKAMTVATPILQTLRGINKN